jgi:hypothetical protein
MKPHFTNTDNPIDFPKTKNQINERIRELQKQSSIEQWDYDNGCYRYILNPEKFAELIVRECAKVVGEAELGYDDYRGQIEKGMRDYCQQYLKKTFGVE